MADTSCERQVVLDKYLDGVKDMLIYSGTTGHINPKYKKVSRTVYENENGNVSTLLFSENKCIFTL